MYSSRVSSLRVAYDGAESPGPRSVGLKQGAGLRSQVEDDTADSEVRKVFHFNVDVMDQREPAALARG